jgi:hypothetical protein
MSAPLLLLSEHLVVTVYCCADIDEECGVVVLPQFPQSDLRPRGRAKLGELSAN